MTGQSPVNDDHGKPGGGHVLLGPGEDQPEAGNIYRPGQDLRGHVAHQGHRAGLGHVVPGSAENGVVGAVIKVFRVGRELQLLLGRNPVKLSSGAVGSKVHTAVLPRLLGRDGREVPGDGVVRRVAGGGEIQGDHGKLQGAASLEEQYLMGIGHVQRRLQLGLGVVEDVQVLLTSMTHLHNGKPRPPIIHQLRGGTLQHRCGQHRRTGGKIKDLFAIHTETPFHLNN